MATLKLTANVPENQWLEEETSFWNSQFERIMLVSRRVSFELLPMTIRKYHLSQPFYSLLGLVDCGFLGVWTLPATSFLVGG